MVYSLGNKLGSEVGGYWEMKVFMRKCRDIAFFLRREPTSLSYIEQQITDAAFNQIMKKLKW